MVSKKLAIELVKALYQSTNGLLPYTLYSRFKMNAVDILAFVKQYQPKELIAVDEELRIKLTEEGRRYALGLINQHKGEPVEGGSEYYKKIQRPQLDKYDPYIPDKVFEKKYKRERVDRQKLAVRSAVAPL